MGGCQYVDEDGNECEKDAARCPFNGMWPPKKRYCGAIGHSPPGSLSIWRAKALGEAAFLARSEKEAVEVSAWEAAHRDPNIRQTAGCKVGQGARPSTAPPRAAPPAAAKKEGSSSQPTTTIAAAATAEAVAVLAQELRAKQAGGKRKAQDL